MLPTPVSIEVPPNAIVTDKIQGLFTNLIDNSVVLCIVSSQLLRHLLHLYSITIFFQENKKKIIDSSENITLRELKSGSSVNTEVLKLLPSETIPIKNCENSTSTHFENGKCTYVAEDHDLENVKVLKETIDSNTGQCSYSNVVKYFKQF